MPNFFWRDVEDRWFDRFPEWALGAGMWREFAPDLVADDPRPIEALKAHRRDLPPHERLRCPRLFISHKREDVDCALQIARIAEDAGMEFWLDVTDPKLQQLQERRNRQMTPAEKALATAMVIEMALLNCSHVIAVLTRKTARSRWVPYEYGRVKEDSLHSLQAASWRHPELPEEEMGDYLHLGAVHTSGVQIRGWVEEEVRRWPGPGSCPEGTWTEREWENRLGPTCLELREP